MRFDKKIVVCIVAIDNFFGKQVGQVSHYRLEPKADAEASNQSRDSNSEDSVLALSDATVDREFISANA